ncbi:MAG: SRPBCC domain-containing protein [Ginsengibacter sp.]
MVLKRPVTIETTCKVPVEKVWKAWTTPGDIIRWNSASEDWHTSSAENDLRVGGILSSRMEVKDGSVGFDFWGIYDEVKQKEFLEYTMDDGRKAKIIFTVNGGDETKITKTFKTEDENSIEMQRTGWQATLDNFKNMLSQFKLLKNKSYESTNRPLPVVYQRSQRSC